MNSKYNWLFPESLHWSVSKSNYLETIKTYIINRYTNVISNFYDISERADEMMLKVTFNMIIGRFICICRDIKEWFDSLTDIIITKFEKIETTLYLSYKMNTHQMASRIKNV